MKDNCNTERSADDLLRGRWIGCLSLRDGLVTERLKGVRLSYLFVGCFLGLFVFLMLNLFTWIYSAPAEMVRTVRPLSLLVAVWIALGTYILSLLPAMFRVARLIRSWTNSTGLFACTETNVSFLDDGVTFSDRNGNAFLRWYAFVGYREADGIICLYTAFPHNFTVLSRSKMEQQQDWPKVLDIIRHKCQRL